MKNLIKKYETSPYIEEFTKSQHWTKLLEQVCRQGKNWAIERKYRRILTKRIAGKVRAHVREQNDKIENLEKIAKNRQKDLAKEVAKMVQKEFWNKVEKVAYLFQEKREEKEMQKQMDQDLNDMMSKTEVFSKSLAQEFVLTSNGLISFSLNSTCIK